MAIDTKLKRASVQAATLGLARPPPDGIVGDADRAVSAWFYAGLPYGPQPEVPGYNIAHEVASRIVKQIAFDPTEIRRDKL